MFIGLGIGLNSQRVGSGGGAAWTPASLGAALKGWWDISDLTTLFQDSAGTTPVTTDSQPIGKVTDKSGTGSHLVQATAAARPLYKTATLPKATLDGIDDILGTAADVTLTDASGQWYAALAFKYASFAASKILLTYDVGTNAMGTPFTSDATPLLKAQARRSDATVLTDTHNVAPTTTQPVVIIATASVSGTIKVEVFVDGVSDGATDWGAFSLLVGVAKVNIGDIPGNGTAQAGDLYAGVIGTGVLSSADRASLLTYLGSKCGRTL